MDFSGFEGIIFRGFHVPKTEAIWSFSLHCVQSISLKFSNVKKEQIFAGFLLEGVCFHGIELSQINDKSAKFVIIRPRVNFIPNGYFNFFSTIAYSISQSINQSIIF